MRTLLKYPDNMPTPLQMIVTPLKIFRSRSIGATLARAGEIISDGWKGKQNKLIKFKTIPSFANIMLPIPNGFATNISHTWNERETFYTDIITNIKGAITSALGKIGKVQTILAGEGLTAYEPKITHYESTAPMEFSFEWKFTPKTKEEIRTIYKITKVFQLGSMPKGTAKGGIGILRALKSPHLWRLQFIPNLKVIDPNDIIMSKYYYFKKNTLDEMILTSVNTNYTPDGDFYPLLNGTPTSLTLSLNFRMSRSILEHDRIFGTEQETSLVVDSILN